MQLYGPRLSTTKNKIYWVIGPACTGSVMFPRGAVVVLLKLERIRPIEFSIYGESFILLKAGSYNKFVAL